MPRPTKEQIDAEIVDAAAALFARHGFRQTSVQAVADEVGYSKAGLLHRFPSKESLWQAVVADACTQLEAVVEAVRDLPVGRSRDAQVVEAFLDLADRRRGVLAFMLSLLAEPRGAAEDDPLAVVAASALSAFGVDPEQVDERATRVVGALGSVAVTSLMLVDHSDMRPHAVAAALGALGHPVDTGVDTQLPTHGNDA